MKRVWRRCVVTNWPRLFILIILFFFSGQGTRKDNKTEEIRHCSRTVIIVSFWFSKRWRKLSTLSSVVASKVFKKSLAKLAFVFLRALRLSWKLICKRREKMENKYWIPSFRLFIDLLSRQALTYVNITLKHWFLKFSYDHQR